MSERPPLATIPAGRDAFGPIRMIWRDGLEKCESFRGVRTTIQAAFEHGSSARASSKLPRGEGANAGCGVRLVFARCLRLPAAGNGSPEPCDCHLNFLLLLCWAAKARCEGVEL